MVCNPQVEEFWNVSYKRYGWQHWASSNRALPEQAFHSFHDYPFFKPIKSTMQWTKLSWQSAPSSLHPNGDVHAAHNWTGWNVDSVPSAFREESRPVSVESFVEWFVNISHPGCRRPDPFLRLNSHSEENFFISLWDLSGASPSPGCEGTTDESEKWNLSSESEDMPFHKLCIVFSWHPQVHLASFSAAGSERHFFHCLPSYLWPLAWPACLGMIEVLFQLTGDKIPE